MMSPPCGPTQRGSCRHCSRLAPEPDPMTTMQSFMVRQSLLRAWGEFQEEHPLIVAPIYTDVPFEVGRT